MEHRHGARFKVSLPISVKFGHTGLGWFTSRDVGNGGIALNGDVNLPRNSVVSLSIESREFNRVVTDTARAVVVHQGGGRIGLMWISRGISLKKLLRMTADVAAA